MERRIIIFDMDGVLFDSNIIAEKNMQYLYPSLTKEIHKEILTGNFHEELEKLTISKRLETAEEKEVRQLQYSKDKSQVLMYKGAKELLNDLKAQGYTLILNTSALNRNCLPLLENSQIKDIFDFWATAEVSKSKVEKFKMIENKYMVGKNDMLFITDTLGDIREADIAGIPTIAVTWGAHDRIYFNREPHDNLINIVDSMSDLRAFIEKWQSNFSFQTKSQ